MTREIFYCDRCGLNHGYGYIWCMNNYSIMDSRVLPQPKRKNVVTDNKRDNYSY